MLNIVLTIYIDRLEGLLRTIMLKTSNIDNNIDDNIDRQNAALDVVVYPAWMS